MAQLPFVGTPVVGPDDFPFIGMPDIPFENKGDKGEPNGYAPLDANAKVPVANLPDTASLDAEVDGKITTHNSATTSVHGIANTANLVLTNDARLSDSRTPTTHSHSISDVTSLQTTLDGKALSSHTHTIANVTGLQTALDGKQASGSYVLTGDSRLSDARTPTAHSHAISDVTNLQTSLDGKQASGSYAPASGISPTAITGTAVITTDSRLSDARTPVAHSHAISDVTNLQTTLDGKALSSHTHTVANVTGLQTALDGKQASGSYAPATGISPSAITGTAVITTDSRISGIGAGSIKTSLPDQINLGSTGGSITSDGYGGSINTGGYGGSISTNTYGGTINTGQYGGSITTGPNGGSINTTGQGSIGLGTLNSISGSSNAQTLLIGSATGTDKTITLPNATGTIALTSDSRFTDSRTPTSHTHGNITNSGAVGSTANLPLITTTSGRVTTGTFGTTVNSFCAGDDSRLSNSRTPTSHSHSISEVTSLQATLIAFAIALG